MNNNNLFNLYCDIIDFTESTMDNYMFVIDFENDIYHISRSALDRFGLSDNHIFDFVNTLEQVIYPSDYQAIRNEMTELKTSSRAIHNMQYRWVSQNGSPIWINCRGRCIQKNGKNIIMVGCLNEIGAKQKADNITGLLRLGDSLTLPQEISDSYFRGFLIRINVDDLRGINAKIGTDFGDLAISQTSECILSELESDQYVFHINGDEFLILSMNHGDYNDARDLFIRIRNDVEAKIQQKGFLVVYSISAGIVTSSDLGDYSFDSLMKASEFALSSAKSLGKNTYTRFNIEMYKESLTKELLANQLRSSIKNDFKGFEVYYQILTSPENKIIGAEALMRYHLPNGSPVSPADFIPVLEDTGLIIPAGKWILETAISDCLKVCKYNPDFMVSVNISFMQVLKTNMAKTVKRALEKYGLPAKNLMVELTESGFLESDLHYQKTWSRLKSYGIKMALDDFGTGYSNFHYLNELKPNVIKTDRSFTVAATKDEYEHVLLEHVASLAHTLHCGMCIEGVETEAELELAKALEPTYIQGYYFGKPEPLSSLLKRFS